MNRRQYAFPAAIVAIAVIAGIIVLIANSGGDDDNGKGTAAGGCKKVSAPEDRAVKKRKPPTLRLDPSKTYRATVVTNCGTFVIALDSKRAPVTGGSFVTLARAGFYNGLGFHRIAPGFVVQGGDPA